MFIAARATGSAKLRRSGMNAPSDTALADPNTCRSYGAYSAYWAVTAINMALLAELAGTGASKDPCKVQGWGGAPVRLSRLCHSPGFGPPFCHIRLDNKRLCTNLASCPRSNPERCLPCDPRLRQFHFNHQTSRPMSAFKNIHCVSDRTFSSLEVPPGHALLTREPLSTFGHTRKRFRTNSIFRKLAGGIFISLLVAAPTMA
jgi:hypothetical protein